MTFVVNRAAAQFSTEVKHPKAEGYNIRVGAVWYRTVASPQTPITIGTRDSLAERQDRSGSIYQNVLDIGYAWGRTDLSGGEGLDWDPRELALEQDQAALDTIRYWDSEGINTRRPEREGEPYTLQLARTFEDWGGSTTNPKDMSVSNQFIYIADGITVTRYTGWDDLTGVAMTGLPGTEINAISAAPNDAVMVTLVDGDVWIKPAEDTIFEVAYDVSVGNKDPADGVWYLQGRFIISIFRPPDQGQLAEMLWNGTDWTDAPIVIDTADGPFWSVVESGPAIVAACDDGTIRTYTPDNATGGTFNLVPKARTTAPEGETPILLGSNAGVLLIMTTADIDQADRETVRLYQAEVLDARFDFVVGQLQLKRAWNGVEHEGLVTRNMTNTRDEIFWFVKEEVNKSGTYTEALWRFDVVTGGLTRVLYDDPAVNLNGLSIFDNTVGAIDFNGPGIRISDPDLHQAFGYMVFPNITFGLNTPITWIATVVEAQDLVNQGAQVELWRSSDPQAILDWEDPSWVLVQRLSSQGASNLEVPMQNLSSRTLALQLRMFATEGATISPKVSRIAIRGIPAHRDFIMMVPFNISDYVSVPGRSPTRIPGLGNELHEQVLALVGKNVEAIVLDPFVRFQGVVNNISEPITYLANRGSVTKHVMVEFRGSRLPATATQPPTGDDGMGLGLMGIATIGLGQTEGT